MINRQQYLNREVTHRQYWGQFVNELVKDKVKNSIGVNTLLESTDEHLNDIPIAKWDKLGGFVWRGQVAIQKPQTSLDILPIDAKLLRETGEGVSSAGLVCIYKEAARQIIEQLSVKKEN